MLAREGQHIGVVTNAFTKSAPSRCKIFCVFVMTSGDPSSLSKSSARIKTMLGLLVDPVLPRTLFFGLRAADDKSHNRSTTKTAYVFAILDQNETPTDCEVGLIV